MPLVQITLLAGRTTEQKRRIAERITDVMVEEAKTPRDGVVVTFVDVPTDSYARGGVLMKDRIEQQQNTVKT
jgi:4-oxalocrotonate tautomerase